MRVNTGSTKKAEKKGVSFTWKRPQISIKAAGLLGAVLVLVFAVLLLTDLHRSGLRTTLNVHPRDGVRAFEDAYPEVAKRVAEISFRVT